MKKLIALLMRPPVPQVLGLGLLSVVVWYGGRALRSWHRLSDGTLLAIVAALWIVAALVFVWRRFQAAKRAQLIEDRLRGQAREHKESVRPDRRNQVEELERQLEEALTSLRTSKLGKSALYALPWYVIIGPPGSGKTTLLRESSLSFPQQKHGRGVRGMGGTRNCDWWFTDQGILLDTAGRYTTQDEDRSEWLAFLDMLKKARTQKPLNGAMIAISIADVLQADDDQLAEHARKIRERLDELTARLEVVFPVYLLFSKCDLLDGFVETFDGLTKKERAQVWGFTLPYDGKGDGALAARFEREFDALHGRVAAERLGNLAKTKVQRRKTKIFSFPMQFALAKERLQEFLKQLDQPSPYHERSEFRGCYFTSGTQEGTPLDQVLRRMSEASGLQQATAEQGDDAVEKKAYFIDDVFTEIIFADKELARSSAKAEQRRRVVRRAGMAASIAATLALSVALVVAYAGHANLIERSAMAYAAAEKFDPRDERALAEEERLADGVGGPFEQLRRIFVELDEAYGSVGSYVLGQQNALYEQRIRPLYVKKLRAALLEPLQERIRVQLQQAVDEKLGGRDVGEVADLLTAYQMLGGQLLLNRTWLGEDFLKRADSWTWRPGQEVAACRPHRDTFVERVAGPMERDWTYLPEEALIPAANDLVRGKDIFGRELQEVLEEQGQSGTVSWSQILADNPGANLLDDSVGVTQAFVNEAPLDEILTQKGELLGGNSGEALVNRRRQEAIDSWKNRLAQLGPRRKSNLADAMDDVAKLTGEDSIYLRAYEEACTRLQRLGVECRVGDTAWLVETIAAIRDLDKVVRPLCEASDHLDRVVPSAKAGKGGDLDKLRRELKKVRNTIRVRTEEYADPQLEASIQSSLIGAVDSLQYALAREIVEETAKVWREGLGAVLDDFSGRFPFRTAEAGVDPGRFEAVFGRDGEFDRAAQWIAFLEETLEQTGFASMTSEFADDRAFVARMQQALFPQSGQQTAGCRIDFLLQKRGNMSSVRFTLGDAKIETRASQAETLAWAPAAPAAIEILGFKILSSTVDARLEFRDTWGFLRLLAAGTPDTANVRDATYQVCLWTGFKHPTSGEALVAGDVRAEAALLFRTSAEPNPLAPGFFAHTFAAEVFRAK